MNDAIMNVIGIPPRYKSACLEDFPKFAFEPQRSYFLYGEPGGGKTRLLCAIVKEVGACGVSRFCTAGDLLAQIREGMFADKRANELETFRNRKFLAIDDIGGEKVTDWTVDVFYSIINYRYNNLLPTYFASNWNLVELGKNYDLRIARRIGEMCTVVKLNHRKSTHAR